MFVVGIVIICIWLAYTLPCVIILHSLFATITHITVIVIRTGAGIAGVVAVSALRSQIYVVVFGVAYAMPIAQRPVVNRITAVALVLTGTVTGAASKIARLGRKKKHSPQNDKSDHGLTYYY